MSDDALKIFQLPPATIEPLWASLREKLLPAIDRSRGMCTEQSVFEALSAFRWQCWVAYEGTSLKAVTATRIFDSPSGTKVLNAVLTGGEDRKLWQRPMVEKLKEFMRAEGCAVLSIVGRRGWERSFPEFKAEQIVLEYRDNG